MLRVTVRYVGDDGPANVANVANVASDEPELLVTKNIMDKCEQIF